MRALSLVLKLLDVDVFGFFLHRLQTNVYPQGQNSPLLCDFSNAHAH